MRNKRWLAALLAVLAAVLMPLMAFAEQGDALYLIGSRKASGSLQLVMNLRSGESPAKEQIRVAFSGLGIPDFQWYPYEKLQLGTSYCILADVASSTRGRGMRDARTIITKLMEGMTPGDNACILSGGEAALTEDLDGLRAQARTLPLFSGDRSKAIAQAVALMTEGETAHLRKAIILLSDGTGTGGDCSSFTKAFADSRIPVFYVSLLYGSPDSERLVAEKALSGLAAASRGGAVYQATLSPNSAERIASALLADFGSAYVLELESRAIENYMLPQGGEIHVELQTGTDTLSDTMLLSADALAMHAYQPEVKEASPSPAPTASVPPETPAETVPPPETAAPTTQPPESTDAAPAAAETDAVQTDDAAEGPSPAPAEPTEESPGGTWFSALAPGYRLALCIGVPVVIAALVLLVILVGKMRIYTGRKKGGPSEGCTVVLPTSDARRQATDRAEQEKKPLPAVHLRLIRQDADGATVLEMELDAPITIGREPSMCQWIPENDPTLAAQDCRLAYETGRLMLYDLTGRQQEATVVPSGGSVYIGSVPYQIFWEV